MPILRIVLIGAAAALIALTAGLIAVWPREFPPEPFTATGAAAHGSHLALIGDCAICHTAPGGAPYAGGRALETNFGVIYSTNITTAGLNGWSYAAFRRAMTEGVSRDGHFLYPAFPYDHFRHLRDPDLRDLYAFVTKLAPVEATTPKNRLIWPLGFRPLLFGWRLLFAHGGSSSDSRGQYLADALAHCGACHTPRNGLGAEDASQSYDGGWSDGYFAPPLNDTSPAPRAWTEADLYDYLRTGFSARHGAAAGPMAAVAANLSRAPDSDVHALAGYFASLAPNRDRSNIRHGLAEQPEGAALFDGACAPCHADGAPMTDFGRPPLGALTSLYEATPRDALAAILHGVAPAAGRAGPYMPAFSQFDDAQLTALAAYLRARFTDAPPWDLADQARQARAETKP